MGNRKERAIQKIKREARKKLLKKLAVAGAITVIIGCIIGAIVYSRYRWNLGNEVIDWNKVKYELDIKEQETVAGAVTQESYYEVRRAASAKIISKLWGVLPEKVYSNLIKGLESKYYKDVCYAEYYETLGEIKSMMAQSEYMLALYDAYKSNDDFEDIDYCNTEDCELKEFIDSYTGNELREYLLDVHQKWESLVYYFAKTTEVDDDTMEMFYQEEIATNLDYIESIEVEAYTLSGKLLTMLDDDWVETLRDKGLIPMRKLNILDKNALEMLSLYRSNKFYDANIASLAYPTMVSITGGNAINADSVVDLSDVEDIDEAIKMITPPSSTDNSKVKIKDMPYIAYSLTEQGSGDKITIFYDIKSIKHIDNMPTPDDLEETLATKAKIYLAEKALTEELDRLIKEDLGEDYESIYYSTDDEDHDHDGDGIPDHVYDPETGEWVTPAN